MKSLSRLHAAVLITGMALFVASAIYFDLQITFPRG